MDMFAGADGEDWSMWFPQDALDEQHHPLEGGLPYLLLPVAAGLSACGYMAKVFAHRRLAVRGSLGEGREWADDDMSLCSSTRGSSRLSGRDEARSFLSARTALSMSESVEELSKLLSTYHLDNSTRLTQSLCESMSSASLSTLCPTQLSLNADAQSSLSESSWGSQLASLSSLSAKDSMPAGSDLDSRSTSKSIKQHLSSARLRNSSSKAHTPRQASKHHNHPSSMLGPGRLTSGVSSHGGSEVGSSAGALSPPASSFCGTRLHIVGRMRCSETVTAAGDLPFSIVRCRFNWYRFDPADNPGTSDKNLKPVRIQGAHGPAYTMTAQDINCRLRVVAYVIGADGQCTNASISALSEPVDGAMQNLPLPSAVQPPGSSQEGDGQVLRTKSGEVLSLQSLKIEGRPQCGVQILAKGKAASKQVKCRFQWTRLSMDQSGNITKTKLTGVNTPWYTPAPEDVGCWLRVKAAPVLHNGILGHATVATTEQRVAPATIDELKKL